MARHKAQFFNVFCSDGFHLQ